MSLSPERSRLLVLWWGAVHVLAIAGLLLSAMPIWATGLATLLVAWHLWRRWPREPVPLERGVDGHWSLPTLGLHGLSLAPGSSVGPFWADLRFSKEGNRAARGGGLPVILILRDQVDAESWRALQAELRRGS